MAEEYGTGLLRQKFIPIALLPNEGMLNAYKLHYTQRRIEMFDQEKALKSVEMVQQADGDLEVLTANERRNLVTMIDDFCRQQGWDPDELVEEP